MKHGTTTITYAETSDGEGVSDAELDGEIQQQLLVMLNLQGDKGEDVGLRCGRRVEKSRPSVRVDLVACVPGLAR